MVFQEINSARPANFGKITSRQIHNFSHASQEGYGDVTYLKTVPRMELSAAVLATRLGKITREELSQPLDQSFFWTDSTCMCLAVHRE